MRTAAAIVLAVLLLTGCGPNRLMIPEYKYFVEVKNSPGAIIVLPFWSGDFPSTEKYDTSQTPQFSAEIPLIPKGLPEARELVIPPDTGSYVIVWSAKRGVMPSEKTPE